MSHQSRRRFLQSMASLGVSGAGLALLAGCGGLNLRVGPALGEPSLETTTLRMSVGGSICQAPRFVAEELLRAEGFTDVQYQTVEFGNDYKLASGAIDLNADFAPMLIRKIDAGDPITILGGLHVGCF